MRFLVSSLFNAGLWLFTSPSRTANVLNFLKSTDSSKSVVTFCASTGTASSSEPMAARYVARVRIMVAFPMTSSPQYSQYFVELCVDRGQLAVEAIERKLGVPALLHKGVSHLVELSVDLVELSVDLVESSVDVVESAVDRGGQGIQLLLDAIDALRQRLGVCHFRGHGKPTIVMAGIKHRQCRISRRREINRLGMERRSQVAESAPVQRRPVRRSCQV